MKGLKSIKNCLFQAVYYLTQFFFNARPPFCDSHTKTTTDNCSKCSIDASQSKKDNVL